MATSIDVGATLGVKEAQSHSVGLQLLLEGERVKGLSVGELAALFPGAVLFLAGLDSELVVAVLSVAEPALNPRADPLNHRITSLAWAYADKGVVDYAGGNEDGCAGPQAPHQPELPEYDVTAADRGVVSKCGDGGPSTRGDAVRSSSSDKASVRASEFKGESGVDAGRRRIQGVGSFLEEVLLLVPKSVEGGRAEYLQKS